MRNSGSELLKIESSTFAGNNIGSQVFELRQLTLHRSIVWQPGVPVLSQSEVTAVSGICSYTMPPPSAVKPIPCGW